jgi:3-oxoacyl-[acyl-carrier-protein] synthase III
MGTIIDHTSVTHAAPADRESALRIAVAAAKTCLTEAGCDANHLDLLINVGLYRDRNMGEPALAALIQQDIGANTEDPHADAHGTFSFDIANGVCGPLTALRVADGFFRSGSVQRALVVTSDADPGYGLMDDFPFAGVGGALLCSYRDGNEGLGPFHWGNFPDGGASFRTTVRYEDGRNQMHIDVADHLDDTLAVAAAKVAHDCLASEASSLADIDLVIAAPAHPAFATALAAHLGVPQDRIAVADEARAHTAALIEALHEALTAGRAGPGSTILLVAAAAGVTAGAALYRTPITSS